MRDQQIQKIFKVICWKTWQVLAASNALLLSTCLSLLNLLIEICIQKLSNALTSPANHLVLAKQSLLHYFHKRTNLAQGVFLVIELKGEAVDWPKLFTRSARASWQMMKTKTMMMMHLVASHSHLAISHSWLSLSQFLLSLSFSYNLQSCPVNFALDLHLADVCFCFVSVSVAVAVAVAVDVSVSVSLATSPQSTHSAAGVVLCVLLLFTTCLGGHHRTAQLI